MRPVDLGKPAANKIVDGLLFTLGHVGGKAPLSALRRRSRLPYHLDRLVYHGTVTNCHTHVNRSARERRIEQKTPPSLPAIMSPNTAFMFLYCALKADMSMSVGIGGVKIFDGYNIL